MQVIMPAITIIVPVYKTEKYIARCLESLVNQTFRDIEIICVNDGSPDNAPVICEEYAQRDSRIILLAQTSQGLSAARNIGLSHAHGEYIQFCDSEDYSEITMCEKLYNAIVTSGADIAMGEANIICDNAIMFTDQEYYSVPFRGICPINDDVFKKTNAFVWNKIFKKSLLDQYGITFPYGLYYEDTCFLFKYLMVSKAIYYVDEPLYNYVFRSDSIMAETRKAIDHVYIINDVAHFMGVNDLVNKFVNIFTWMTHHYTYLACLWGGEHVHQKAFEAGAALLNNIDYNTAMGATIYNKDDVIRLYALKKIDRDLYFSVDRANAERESLIQERDLLIQERDSLIQEQEYLIQEQASRFSIFEQQMAELAADHAKTFDRGLKDDLFIPALRSCLFFPWYIYKTFCMIYNKPCPKRSISILLRSCFFFPYYVLKIYLTMLARQGVAKICNNPMIDSAAGNILTKGRMDYYNGTVSVIIPVYNGCDDLKKLIPMLKLQRKVKRIEIVVVDSGSTDGSFEFLKKEKVNLTIISHLDFSHSKTRNLGSAKASGDILLFMTQDALPSNRDWVFKMILPLIEHGVVAATCVEQIKEDSSPFTYLANSRYREYFGVCEGDRIASLPAEGDFYSLRRNALLNNIACVVKKEIFNKFLYRGEYAEDLDFGIRLLQSGYKIAFLSSVYVIHSHERSCSYYFRLAYVDSKTIKNIVPYFPGTDKSLEEIVAAVFFAYYNLQVFFIFIESLQGDLEVSAFFNFFMHYWNNGIAKNPVTGDKLVFGLWYSDAIVDDFLRMALKVYPELNLDGDYYIESLKFYFDVPLRNYLATKYKTINAGLRKQIIDALFKSWLWSIANDFALYFCDHPDNKHPLFEHLENISKGI
jgi:glycosyltransferase involved in cell wall biosynthesis